MEADAMEIGSNHPVPSINPLSVLDTAECLMISAVAAGTLLFPAEEEDSIAGRLPGSSTQEQLFPLGPAY
jgi:hypothetical protein